MSNPWIERASLVAALALLAACEGHDAQRPSPNLDGGASDATGDTDDGATQMDGGETTDAEETGGSDGMGDTDGDDPAVPDDAPFLLYDGEGGVTRDYFNREASLAWNNQFGDWHDAEGTPQGEVPIATVTVPDRDAQQVVEIDLGASLVEAPEWLWQGVLLRVPAGAQSGITDFHSREATDPALRPKLVLTDAGGTTVELTPAADVHVDGSTSKGLGTAPTWRVSSTINAMLRFAPPDAPIVPTDAKLVLTTTDQQYGTSTIGAYFLTARAPKYLPVTTGLAADYPRDEGTAPP